jgi:hypothetical protein
MYFLYCSFVAGSLAFHFKDDSWSLRRHSYNILNHSKWRRIEKDLPKCSVMGWFTQLHLQWKIPLNTETKPDGPQFYGGQSLQAIELIWLNLGSLERACRKWLLRRIHLKKYFQMHNTIVTISHLQTPSPLKTLLQKIPATQLVVVLLWFTLKPERTKQWRSCSRNNDNRETCTIAKMMQTLVTEWCWFCWMKKKGPKELLDIWCPQLTCCFLLINRFISPLFSMCSVY